MDEWVYQKDSSINDFYQFFLFIFNEKLTHPVCTVGYMSLFKLLHTNKTCNGVPNKCSEKRIIQIYDSRKFQKGL